MMTDDAILNLITREFKNKTLGATGQYLEIHQPVYKDSILSIARIDREQPGLIIAYLPVLGERFSFAVYIDPEREKVLNIGTESNNVVSLVAESDTLTATELQAFTKLIPAKAWTKGDAPANKKSPYKFSRLEFIPNPEPDEFQDKLDKLLFYLAQDKEGVSALTNNADVFLQVIMEFHAGNQLFGAAAISQPSLKKLSDLGVRICFDFSAWGEPFI